MERSSHLPGLGMEPECQVTSVRLTAPALKASILYSSCANEAVFSNPTAQNHLGWVLFSKTPLPRPLLRLIKSASLAVGPQAWGFFQSFQKVILMCNQT